jgi:hypothetical protein
VPPRHAYWTIIVGNLPTAFRAARREELLPTFEQLRRTHPDALLRWFARGRLWESPEAARERPVPAQNARGGDWRPGGAHRDPRDRVRKERQARWRAVRERSYLKKQAAGERRDDPVRRPQQKRPAPPRRQERPQQERPAPPRRPERPQQERPAPPRKQERRQQERPAPPRPIPEPPNPPPPEEIVIPGRPAERGSRRRDGSKRVGGRPPQRGRKRR